MKITMRRVLRITMLVCGIGIGVLVAGIGLLYYVFTRPIETSGCPWFFAGAFVSDSISADDYVQLQRTGCYGPCPAYRVRISGSGAVEWDGDTDVEVTGQRAATIPSADAILLIQAFRSQGFWSLCSRYWRNVSDNPTHTTIVSIGADKKQVINYARGAPAWLTDLEDQVDSLADTHRWRHGDPRNETFSKLYEDIFMPKPEVTALMVAAGAGNIPEVTRLLKNGSDPNMRDSSGWTALMYGAQTPRRSDITAALLGAGADARIRSFAGQTAIMAAARAPIADQTIPLLIQAGDDINIQDGEGETALMAGVRGYPPAWHVDKLLKLGARRDLRDKQGRTALDRLLVRCAEWDPNRRQKDVQRDCSAAQDRLRLEAE